jgi:hypothetical protein
MTGMPKNERTVVLVVAVAEEALSLGTNLRLVGI